MTKVVVSVAVAKPKFSQIKIYFQILKKTHCPSLGFVISVVVASKLVIDIVEELLLVELAVT